MSSDNITLYCDNKGTIALAKEPKVSPEIEAHRAAV